MRDWEAVQKDGGAFRVHSVHHLSPGRQQNNEKPLFNLASKILVVHLGNTNQPHRKTIRETLSDLILDWVSVHSDDSYSCNVHCPVRSDDDTTSQGKGESLLESLGRSLHPELIKV